MEENISVDKNNIAVELGRRGGLKTKERLGREHYVRIAKISAERRANIYKKNEELIVTYSTK